MHVTAYSRSWLPIHLGFIITFFCVHAKSLYPVAPSSCFRVMQEDTGNFQSPGFPVAYDNNRDCTFIIILTNYSDTVKLQFTSLDLEASLFCVDDYVEVRDGSSVAAPLLGRYCGGSSNNPPHTITSTRYSMFVRFHADMNTGGFYAQYAASSVGFELSSGNYQASLSNSADGSIFLPAYGSNILTADDSIFLTVNNSNNSLSLEKILGVTMSCGVILITLCLMCVEAFYRGPDKSEVIKLLKMIRNVFLRDPNRVTSIHIDQSGVE